MWYLSFPLTTGYLCTFSYLSMIFRILKTSSWIFPTQVKKLERSDGRGVCLSQIKFNDPLHKFSMIDLPLKSLMTDKNSHPKDQKELYMLGDGEFVPNPYSSWSWMTSPDWWSFSEARTKQSDKPRGWLLSGVSRTFESLMYPFSEWPLCSKLFKERWIRDQSTAFFLVVSDISFQMNSMHFFSTGQRVPGIGRKIKHEFETSASEKELLKHYNGETFLGESEWFDNLHLG